MNFNSICRPILNRGRSIAIPILNHHKLTIKNYKICQRHIQTQRYKNCTATPKHIIITYTLLLCKDAGKACHPVIVNKHMERSTITGAICPKC